MVLYVACSCELEDLLLVEYQSSNIPGMWFGPATVGATTVNVPTPLSHTHIVLKSAPRWFEQREPPKSYPEMLSFSWSEPAWRSTWTCLSCSALPRTSQALMAMSSRPLAVHRHQRKHSSSKTPSSPSDNSRAITTPSEAPSTEAKPITKEGTERRSSTRLGRRKSKDITQEALRRSKTGLQPNLPSVPPTRHLPPVGELEYRFKPYRDTTLTIS